MADDDQVNQPIETAEGETPAAPNLPTGHNVTFVEDDGDWNALVFTGIAKPKGE